MNHPEIIIEVDLSGPQGNAFYLLGKVTSELKSAGVSKEEQDNFNDDATSDDYDHLLKVVSQWVTLELV